MIYHVYKPCTALADFVDRFWLCSDTPSHRRARILPSGAIELVINLSEDEVRVFESWESDRCARYSGAVVSGPYRRCLIIDPMQKSTMIGVHFKPGGAFPFLGVPADQLASTHLDLEILWGRTATEMRQRLCATTTVGHQFALIENMLVSRLRDSPQRHRAVSIALATFDRTFGRAPVRDVARRVGLSHRQFIQVFATEVGLTPKLYCRVQRFQKVRDLVRKVEAPDWARVALECGYFDQSHLIREFQALSGLRPVSYLRQSSGQYGQVRPNHTPETE